jgi:hypothetical protein
MSKFDDFDKLVQKSGDVRKAVDEAYKKLGDDLTQAHMTYFNRMVQVGKDNGIDVTADEVAERFHAKVDELSDSQLEAVAGGAYALSSPSSIGTFSPRTMTTQMPGTGPIAAT